MNTIHAVILRRIRRALDHCTLTSGEHPRFRCFFCGHEKWIAQSGEWGCMRCGKIREIDESPFPRLPDRLRELDTIPKFDA